MKRTFLLVVLCACAGVLAADEQARPLQADIDAYMAQVTETVGRAFGSSELAMHPELADAGMKFSFRVNREGRPDHIEATVTPNNPSVERIVVQVISGLKFAPIPKRIIDEGGYEYLEFRTQTVPKGDKTPSSNQTMQPTARRRTASFLMINTPSFQSSVASTSGA
jgi:hypothetical protein